VGQILDCTIDLLIKWKAVAALVEAIDHRHPRIRQKAEGALAEVTAAEAVPLLLRRFLEAEVVGDESHRRLAEVLSMYGWQPENDRQQVYFAIARNDWYTVTSLGPAALQVVLEVFRERSFAEQLETPVLRALFGAGEYTLAPLRELLRCPRLYELTRYPVLGALERMSSFLAAAHDWHALPLLRGAYDRVESLGCVDSALKGRAQEWLAKAIDEIRRFHNMQSPATTPVADW